MNCPHCGQPVSENAKACGHCGQWVTAPPAPQSVTPPAAASARRIPRWSLVAGGILVLLLIAGGVIIGLLMNRPQSPPDAVADQSGGGQLRLAAELPTAAPTATPTPTATATPTPAEPTPDKTATVAQAVTNRKATEQARAEKTVTVQARATTQARSTATAQAEFKAMVEAMPVVFEDDFSSNDQGWALGEDSSNLVDTIVDIADGRYQIQLEAKSGVVNRETIPLPSKLQDLWLSVDATLVESSGGEPGDIALGFAIRRKDGDYYRVAFNDKNQYWVSLLQNGEWVSIKPRTGSLITFNMEPGVTNNFAVLVQGKLFTLYANGQEIRTVSSTTLPDPGEVALTIGLSEAGQSANIEFDNLVIRLPESEQARQEQLAAAEAEAAQQETAAIEAMPVVFQDDFTTNANQWWTGESSASLADWTFNLADGRYRMQVEAKDNVLLRTLSPLPANLRDFWLSADVTLVETSGVGPGDISACFSFRETDGDYYRVAFNNENQYWIDMWQGGDWTTIKPRTDNLAVNLDPGASNNFAMLVQGSEITLYANGQTLGTATDTTLSGLGKIELGVGFDEAGQTATVDFDNLIIRSSENPPVAAASPTPKPLPTNTPIPTPAPQVCNAGQWTTCGGYLPHDGSRPIECPDSHVSECRNGQWAPCVPDPGSCGGGGSSGGGDSSSSPSCNSGLSEDQCGASGGIYMHTLQGWICVCQK